MPTATILVVEDEETVRSVIARTLEEAGFAVLQAEHGEAALEVVRGFLGVLALAVVDMSAEEAKAYGLIDAVFTPRKELVPHSNGRET